MKHKLKISVSKEPQTGGIVTCRNISIRERLLRLLFGDKRRVTVLIPGDSVGEIAICEKGGAEDGQSEADEQADMGTESYSSSICGNVEGRAECGNPGTAF